MTDPTLTDFLLARIAEDAANLPEGFDCWYAPERYEAECEAKRRIVEAAWHLESFDFGTDAYHHVVGKQREILQALALPYADHPDYREEWKP